MAGSLVGELQNDTMLRDHGELQHEIQMFRDTLTPEILNEPAGWYASWHHYGKLAVALAHRLNEKSTIANAYESMESLWSDTRQQETGGCFTTIWDVYENGRRRALEALAARVYKAEGAILVNCGMSALHVAVLWLQQRASTIVALEPLYFETDQLLRLLSDFSRNPIVFAHSAAEAENALSNLERPALMFESGSNYPGGQDTPTDRLMRVCSERAIPWVCDATVHAGFAPGRADQEGSNITVASLSKYISNQCSSGVLFGPQEAVSSAREIARATGSQLQMRALNYLRPADFWRINQRLELHRRNTAIFAQALAKRPGWKMRVTADSAATNCCGLGPIILKRESTREVPARESADYDEIVSAWKGLTSPRSLSVDVRAGFGWPTTSVRVYSDNQLNRSDGQTYIRIAPGAECPSIVNQLAQTMSEALGGARI